MTVKKLGSFIQIYYIHTRTHTHTHEHTHAHTHTHTHTITIIFIKLIPYIKKNVFLSFIQLRKMHTNAQLITSIIYPYTRRQKIYLSKKKNKK